MQNIAIRCGTLATNSIAEREQIMCQTRSAGRGLSVVGSWARLATLGLEIHPPRRSRCCCAASRHSGFAEYRSGLVAFGASCSNSHHDGVVEHPESSAGSVYGLLRWSRRRRCGPEPVTCLASVRRHRQPTNRNDGKTDTDISRRSRLTARSMYQRRPKSRVDCLTSPALSNTAHGAGQCGAC